MSRLISTVISGLSHPHFPLVVLESSLVQSCLPVLRAFVNNRDTTTHVLFFSLLYPPSTLAIDPPREGLYIVDRTAEVPGYSEIPSDHANAILNRVRQAPDGPLTVVIDSADVLCADLESPSKSYTLIATLLSDLSSRPKPSRLVLHFSTPSSPLRDLVLAPRLSPTMAHIIAHPPALLTHLATAQLTPPPPASAPERFWRVFAPLSARAWEVERIVLGPGGVGPSDDGEMVLEVLSRAPEGRGRNVERELVGWSSSSSSATADRPCSLSELDSLKGIFEDRGKTEQHFDTPEVSFNLNLTPDQRKSRAQVPLPYAHKDASQPLGTILYDPDSADDIDDDDPDEDLDI